MKRLFLFAGLALSLCAGVDATAQVRVNLQIGSPVVQQPWYANDNDYYYLPEQGVYYNVRRQVYVYPEGGSWLYARQLPSRYGNYSYRNSHYVQVRDRRPFERDNDYRQRYNANNPHYNGRHDNGNHYGRDRDHDRGHYRDRDNRNDRDHDRNNNGNDQDRNRGGNGNGNGYGNRRG